MDAEPGTFLTTTLTLVPRAGNRRWSPVAQPADHAGRVRTSPSARHTRRRSGAHHLAAQLERSAFVIDDLQIGASVPSIDHVAVASSGIWVIASRPVTLERISIRRPFRATASLRAGDHDHTGLVDTLDHQRTAVTAALADRPHLPIRTAICFPGGQYPLLGSLTIDDHPVLSPTELAARVAAPGGLKRSECRAAAEALAARLG